MLAVPFVLGVAAGGPSWRHVLLLPAWVLAYLVSYFGLQWLRARRRHRYQRPLRVYGVALTVTGAAVVALEPRVLLLVPAYLPGTLVNVWYARRNDERALLNGLVSVGQACLGVPLATVVGADPDWPLAGRLTLLALLYFTGTLLFVKTMIRERGSRSYRTASVAYHAAALVPVAVLSGWLLVPFGLYLARAATLPGRDLRPPQVGAVEIVGSLLLLAFAPVVA